MVPVSLCGLQWSVIPTLKGSRTSQSPYADSEAFKSICGILKIQTTVEVNISNFVDADGTGPCMALH